ncbi:227_t:CDS:2 [Paraglomus brasilianum]|uniref:227_t:CDS:1 n=1 Tax=Paraglomus brasilianum TaxID=144538 RepID=A0A9N8WHB6_9GLOM|nr:227_t:CDS:2 [Paraglomus brasilianum]
MARITDSFNDSLGLSCIVEFSNGMHTWFGDEWTALKDKVYERVNVVSKPFEGVIKEVIDRIDTVRLEFLWIKSRVRGETETKSASSHTECVVRDRSKLLRTNKCVLDHYLMEDIPANAETTVFDLQVAGLNAQLIGINKDLENSVNRYRYF